MIIIFYLLFLLGLFKLLKTVFSFLLTVFKQKNTGFLRWFVKMLIKPPVKLTVNKSLFFNTINKILRLLFVLVEKC